MTHPLSRKNNKDNHFVIIGGVIIIVTFVLTIKFSRNFISPLNTSLNNQISINKPYDSISTSTPYSNNSINILTGNISLAQSNIVKNNSNLPIPQISDNKPPNTYSTIDSTTSNSLIKILPNQQEISLPSIANLYNQTQLSKLISFGSTAEEKLVSNFIAYDKLSYATSTIANALILPSNFPNYWVTNIQMPAVNSITIDQNRRIWLATNKGLVSITNDKIVMMNKENGLFPTNIITSLVHDGTNLWIGTFEGLYKTTDGINFQKYDKSNGLINDIIWSLDWDGSILWIGTQNGFSFLLPNGSFESVDKKVSNNGLADVWIGSIKRSGNYLLVGNDDGLSVWNTTNYAANPNAWHTIDMFTTNLIHNWILSLNVIDNKVYIGTPKGLCIIESDISKIFENLQPVIKIYNKQNGLVGNRVNTVISHKSDVWIGTNEGLSRMRYNTFRNFTTNDGLLSSDVRSLYAIDNYLLVGTSNGLQILNTEIIN